VPNVFVKGLGKILFPDSMGEKEIAEALASKGQELLDMSTKARLARAQQQGFGDKTFFSGTGADITAFDPKLAGTRGVDFGEATFLTSSPEVGSGFSVRHLASDEFASSLKDIDAARGIRAKSVASKGLNHPDTKAAFKKVEIAEGKRKSLFEQIENFDIPTTGSNVIPAKIRGNLLQFDGGGANFIDVNKQAIDQASREGFDGVMINNVVDAATSPTSQASNVAVIFDPKNIRSVNAAFDPARKESSDLLASAVPVAVGLGALATPDQSFADQVQARENETPHDQARRLLIRREDTITADEFPKLEAVADFLDKWGQTPIGPAFEGISTYLRDFGRDLTGKQKAKNAFLAALDVI